MPITINIVNPAKSENREFARDTIHVFDTIGASDLEAEPYAIIPPVAMPRPKKI